MTAALILAHRRSLARGRLILWFGLAYALAKFASECTRGDLRFPVAGIWTAAMLVEIAAAAACAAFLAFPRPWERIYALRREMTPLPFPPPPAWRVVAGGVLEALLGAGVAVAAWNGFGSVSMAFKAWFAWYLLCAAGGHLVPLLFGVRIMKRDGTPPSFPRRLLHGLIAAFAAPTIVALVRPWLDPERRTCSNALSALAPV